MIIVVVNDIDGVSCRGSGSGSGGGSGSYYMITTIMPYASGFPW